MTTYKKLSADQKKQLQNDLNRCSTLNEVLSLLNQRFDLNKPLGMVTKPVIIAGLINNVLPLIDPPTK